ncbi:MAG: type IV pilin-like G/H family protein [Leptolyngbya sp. BL-A-14]
MKILLTPPGALITIAHVSVIALAGCSTSRPSATSAPPELIITSPVASSPTPTPTVTGDPFAKGVDKAASATSLAQSAQTPEDWNLVLTQWQRAIAFMKAVPPSSPNHSAAQKLLPSYQQSLTRAQQQAKRGGASISPIAAKGGTDDNGIPIISGDQPSASADAKDTATTAAATVTALLQQQTEFFAKQKRYAATLAELGGNIPADTPTYAYSTSVLQSKQVVATATAKQDGLPSYTGALFTVKDDKGTETTTTTVCLTSKPSKIPPATPQLVGKDAQCPSGASKV